MFDDCDFIGFQEPSPDVEGGSPDIVESDATFVSALSGNNTYNETGAGGAVAGGVATPSCKYNPALSGGGVVGGVASYGVDDKTIVASGGAVCGGVATPNRIFNPTLSGGAIIGGTATPIDDDVIMATGGVVCGGTATPSVQHGRCPCNYYTLPVKLGGAACGGSALMPVYAQGGGVVCGGSAIVDKPQTLYDGLVGLWPLDDEGLTYLDHSGNNLNGTAGPAPLNPTETMGVFCLDAALFSARQYITTNQDGLAANNPVTISCWVHIDSFWKQRVFFSKGSQTATDNWCLWFGHSYYNQLMAQVNTPQGIISVTGATQLQADTMYHVAMVWEPKKSLRLYVRGVLDATTTTTVGSIYGATNGDSIGQWNNSSWLEGTLQEVRVFAEAKSADFLVNEFESVCDPAYITQAAEETWPF